MVNLESETRRDCADPFKGAGPIDTSMPSKLFLTAFMTKRGALTSTLGFYEEIDISLGHRVSAGVVIDRDTNDPAALSSEVNFRVECRSSYNALTP